MIKQWFVLKKIQNTLIIIISFGYKVSQFRYDWFLQLRMNQI
jgi:hypothetical protein